MNELKITDVVDQKAFEQLERLKSELDSTFAAYKKAGDAMAEGLKIKPGPYSELISKAKDYYAAIEKVYALEDKIKSGLRLFLMRLPQMTILKRQ